jgi:hypothetical protein
MGEKLNFYYDREADILYLSQGNPYPEQDSQEIGDDCTGPQKLDTKMGFQTS